jgi:hypothetical protein
MATKTPREVIHYPNGNVAVTGDDGQQIPELQGKYDDVRDRILDAADERTRFRDFRDASRDGRRSRKLFESGDELFARRAT